jgi:hypothetical protein
MFFPIVGERSFPWIHLHAGMFSYLNAGGHAEGNGAHGDGSVAMTH